uniref:Uncharacterized protein n=1 Tax=Schistocephalus solidus TaxID=70667 RepID=A0A0V0J8N5_SCHSO
MVFNEEKALSRRPHSPLPQPPISGHRTSSSFVWHGSGRSGQQDRRTSLRALQHGLAPLTLTPGKPGGKEPSPFSKQATIHMRSQNTSCYWRNRQRLVQYYQGCSISRV